MNRATVCGQETPSTSTPAVGSYTIENGLGKRLIHESFVKIYAFWFLIHNTSE